MPIGPMMFSISIFGQEPSSNIFANKYNPLLIQGSCYVVFLKVDKKRLECLQQKKKCRNKPINLIVLKVSFP